jgi:hypothetical protein
MSKSINLTIIMNGLPDGCVGQGLAAEIQAMLQKEYADGVEIFASVASEKSDAVDEAITAPTVSPAPETPYVPAPEPITTPVDPAIEMISEGAPAATIDNTPSTEGNE